MDYGKDYQYLSLFLSNQLYDMIYPVAVYTYSPLSQTYFHLSLWFFIINLLSN